MNRKMTLTLSADAIDVLEANASDRKRGEFISGLLVTWGKRQDAERGAGGILERIENKIDALLSTKTDA